MVAALILLSSLGQADSLPPIKALAGAPVSKNRGGNYKQYTYWLDEPVEKAAARFTKEFGKWDQASGQALYWYLEEKRKGKQLYAWAMRSKSEWPGLAPMIDVWVEPRVDHYKDKQVPRPGWTTAIVSVSWHPLPKHPKEKHLRMIKGASFKSSIGEISIMPGDGFIYRIGAHSTMGGTWKAEGDAPKGKRPGRIRRIVFKTGPESQWVGIVHGSPATMDQVKGFEMDHWEKERVVWERK